MANIQLPFSDSALIEYLFSGTAWVCRGNSMLLNVKLAVNGEPLCRDDTEWLADSIINAPVWKQLKLTVSLPVDEMGETICSPDPGHIRICLNHSRTATNAPASLQHHRLNVNISPADVRPPETVPVIGLQSVLFEMALLRRRKNHALARRQRRRETLSRQSTNSETYESTQVGANDSGTVQDPSPDPFPCPLFEDTDNESLFSMRDGGPSNAMKPIENPGILPQRRKRKRSLTVSSSCPETLGIDKGELEKLVDGALRISISSGTFRLAHGIKLSAHTFAGSLAELCPAVWSPHYLAAFSQRSHFLPSISRSLYRAASASAQSLSLRDKTNRLVETRSLLLLSNKAKQDDHQKELSLEARLWMHVQETVSERSTKPHEAFCSFSTQSSQGLQSGQDSEDTPGHSSVNEWDDSESPLADWAPTLSTTASLSNSQESRSSHGSGFLMEDLPTGLHLVDEADVDEEMESLFEAAHMVEDQGQAEPTTPDVPEADRDTEYLFEAAHVVEDPNEAEPSRDTEYLFEAAHIIDDPNEAEPSTSDVPEADQYLKSLFEAAHSADPRFGVWHEQDRGYYGGEGPHTHGSDTDLADEDDVDSAIEDNDDGILFHGVDGSLVDAEDVQIGSPLYMENDHATVTTTSEDSTGTLFDDSTAHEEWSMEDTLGDNTAGDRRLWDDLADTDGQAYTRQDEYSEFWQHI